MRGFTLLELLVVTAIVGILTAIAVPEFSAYRKKAYDTQALSELRSVALGEEAYYVAEEQYLSCENQGCENLPGITRISSGVQIQMVAAGEAFTGSAEHQKGSGERYRWDSAAGGLVE